MKSIPLSDYLKKQQLTQAQFGAKHGIHVSSVGYWSRGGVFVRGKQIVRPEQVLATIE